MCSGMQTSRTQHCFFVQPRSDFAWLGTLHSGTGPAQSAQNGALFCISAQAARGIQPGIEPGQTLVKFWPSQPGIGPDSVDVSPTLVDVVSECIGLGNHWPDFDQVCGEQLCGTWHKRVPSFDQILCHFDRVSRPEPGWFWPGSAQPLPTLGWTGPAWVIATKFEHFMDRGQLWRLKAHLVGKIIRQPRAH